MDERVIDGPEPYDLSPEDAARADMAIEQAERDLAEEVRVNMRIPRALLETIKEAAGLYGMPYQTYIRQAAFRQAIADLKDVQAVALRR